MMWLLLLLLPSGAAAAPPSRARSGAAFLEQAPIVGAPEAWGHAPAKEAVEEVDKDQGSSAPAEGSSAPALEQAPSADEILQEIIAPAPAEEVVKEVEKDVEKDAEDIYEDLEGAEDAKKPVEKTVEESPPPIQTTKTTTSAPVPESVIKVRQYADLLVANMSQNISNEGQVVVATLDTRINRARNQTVWSYQEASQRQSQTVIDTARTQFQDLRMHKQQLDQAVQYSSVVAGVSAAKTVTADETARRVHPNSHLMNESANKILRAVDATEQHWEDSRDNSEESARNAVSEWAVANTELNSTWHSVSEGFARLNDAGEAVNRAGRSTRWDAEASRLSADIAEKSYESAIDDDKRVAVAEEQATNAERLAAWGTPAIINALDVNVKNAEAEALKVTTASTPVG